MRKKIISFLNWLIWVFEGKASGYYQRRWGNFWYYAIPRMRFELRKKLGRIREYSFNTIDVCVTYDPEKILLKAEQNKREQRRIFGAKKAQLSIERYSKIGGKDFIEKEEIIDRSVKLTREERANADQLYKLMSFGRLNGAL